MANLVPVVYTLLQFCLCTMKITYLVHKCQMSLQFGPTIKMLSSPLTLVAYVAQTGLHGKTSVQDVWTKLSLKLKSVKHHINPSLGCFLF